jgi:hypothetical protein
MSETQFELELERPFETTPDEEDVIENDDDVSTLEPLQSNHPTPTKKTVSDPRPTRYNKYKTKYLQNLHFDEEIRRDLIRRRSVSLPLSSTASLPSSAPLAVPAARQGENTHQEHEEGGEGWLSSSSFVPPHQLVHKEITFSVWQYEQKKMAAKHAL